MCPNRVNDWRTCLLFLTFHILQIQLWLTTQKSGCVSQLIGGLSDVNWWSLQDSWPQPGTVTAAGRNLCTCAGAGRPTTEKLCSPPCPGSAPPLAGTSQVPSWTQGKTGVKPFFQTPELSIRCFPSCHQPSKREAGDWKASAIWNKTPGFNRWGMSLPACILLLSIPSSCCYSGTQHFATESYLSIIKKPDLHVASSDRAYQLNCPELQAEVLTT